jgi:uncharacterized protein YjiS (DUF1127 family)
MPVDRGALIDGALPLAVALPRCRRIRVSSPCGAQSTRSALFAGLRALAASTRQYPFENRAKRLPKFPFRLRISYLSYAFYALLRRNIVAFQASEQPYFAGNTIHRLRAGIKRKRKFMFAAIVRFIREWKRYNQSLSELSRLGDRELADIGISRSDIQRVAWNASHHR